MDTVRQYIEAHGAKRPDDIWLIAPDTSIRLTYADLRQGVREIGNHLDEMGIAPAARVGFLADNGGWTTLIYLGVMANGRVIVPLNAVAGDVQLAHVLVHSDTEVVFVAPDYKARLSGLLEQIPRDISAIDLDAVNGPAWPAKAGDSSFRGAPEAVAPGASDTALLLYTSGSTGLPKGAVLSHRAIVAGGRNVVTGHQLTQADRALCVLPIYHINGAMVTVAAPLVSGGSVVMPARFSATAFWPCSPPTIHRLFSWIRRDCIATPARQ